MTSALIALLNTPPDLDGQPAFNGKVWFLPATHRAEMIFLASPGAADIPRHQHPTLTEQFEVLEGHLEVYLEHGWMSLGPGETLAIPPGTIHTLRNPASQACIYRCTVSPAGRFKDMIRQYNVLIRSGKLRSFSQLTSLIYAGLLYDHFQDVQRMTGAKGWLLYSLARLGKLVNMQLPPVP